ncbi:LOW QUALITY PROTEIN: hypothetical protein TorRG33x02_340870, partial [Trema orientale]
SEFGVTDSLRDSEAGDGEAGDQIEPKETQIVFRKPFEDGNEVLDAFLEAERLFFAAKAAKGVVGKEGLFEIGSESGGEFSWFGEVDRRRRRMVGFYWGFHVCIASI